MVGVAELDDFFLGRLIFEFDVIPGNADYSRTAFRYGIHGNHAESYNRIFFASNLRNHVVQAHAHDVFDLAIYTLAYANNLVAFLQLGSALSGSAFDEFNNLGVLVLCSQLRANSLQRQRQAHVEVL